MARTPKPAPDQAPDDPAPPKAGEQRLPQRLLVAREALQRIKRGESPTAEELAAAPRLDFWCVVVDAPFPILQGVVTGHPRLADGAMIGTSPLLWLAEDKSAARTVSRYYRLGVPLVEAPKLHS